MEAGKPKYWALYVGTVKFSIDGISLHKTEREALMSALEYIGTEREDEIEDLDGYKERAELDSADLWDLVERAADRTNDNWHIEEVQAP